MPPRPLPDFFDKCLLKYLVLFDLHFFKTFNVISWEGVMNAFHPSTMEAEAGGSMSLRPSWSTGQVLERPGLHRENSVSQNQDKNKKITNFICMVVLPA